MRDAMYDAAASAWKGARDATQEVFTYQYGQEAGAVAADACDVAEGVGGMAVAMKNAQVGAAPLAAEGCGLWTFQPCPLLPQR